MCGGGGGIGGALNKVQDFAPLRDTFGDNIDYAISPLLSGNQTATGGFAATPGSFAEKKYQNLGVDQMAPVLNMFAGAIAGSAGANALGGGGEGTFPADPEAAGTSAANAPATAAPAKNVHMAPSPAAPRSWSATKGATVHATVLLAP